MRIRERFVDVFTVEAFVSDYMFKTLVGVLIRIFLFGVVHAIDVAFYEVDFMHADAFVDEVVNEFEI
jgi:hypothetical protein